MGKKMALVERLAEEVSEQMRKKIVPAIEDWVIRGIDDLLIEMEDVILTNVDEEDTKWENLSKKTQEKYRKLGITEDTYNMGLKAWAEWRNPNKREGTNFQSSDLDTQILSYFNQVTTIKKKISSDSEMLEEMEKGGWKIIYEQKPGKTGRRMRLAYVKPRPFLQPAIDKAFPKIKEDLFKKLESSLKDIEFEVEF